MSQQFNYPSVGVSISAIGGIGQPIPLNGILIGFEDPSGDLIAPKANASGEIIADISGSIGALATEATLLNVLADTNVLAAVDFATETSLASAVSELQALNSVDFALETTQVALLTNSNDMVTDLDTLAGTVSGGKVNVRDLSSATDSVAATQSGTWNVGITGSLPLPTGSATEAKQDTQITELQSIVSNTANADASLSAILDTISEEGQVLTSNMGLVMMGSDLGTARTLYLDSNGHIAATQSGTWNIQSITGSVVLPTGASTAAKQDTGNASLATIAGAVSGSEMQVDIVSMPSMAQAKEVVKIFNDYVGNPVDTVSWTALSGNIPNNGSVTAFEVFDSSGQLLEVRFTDGVAVSKPEIFQVFPGGNGRIEMTIDDSGLASPVTLEIRAITDDADVGFLAINVYTT